MSKMRNSRIAHYLDIRHVQTPRYSIFYTDIRPQSITFLRTSSQSQRAYSSNSRLSTYNGSSSRLHGRTAMITGGSSGIGYAIAERFLAEGVSKVILVGRRREKLQDALRRLTESILEPLGQSGDVATRAPEEDIHEKMTSSDSKIEVLVGDIAVASEWMAELEKAMVPLPLLFESLHTY